MSAALRTVYSSLAALQRHKSNVSSPATASPASSTASPPSSTTTALTASTNVASNLSNLAASANNTAGNFSTPGAAVKDALWMHKRNEHLESEVSPAACAGETAGRKERTSSECGRGYIQRGASCARCSACMALLMVG